MSLKDTYTIRQIGYKEAMDMVVKYHYLHRKAPCSFAFGLFEKETEVMTGVVTYGTPSSAPLRSGICGPDERFNVIELTRLFIHEGTPKNTESFLIGNTIKLLDKEIVVSFAEAQMGHRGVVYQASNFIYTGLSAKRSNWSISGVDKHCQTIADKYSSAEIREKYGDRFSLVDKPRKHRYVYFNATKRRRVQLMSMLRYPVTPYPKA